MCYIADMINVKYFFLLYYSSYLNALDRFVNRVDLGGETNRKFEQSEFGIHIVEQDARDFNGITFSAVADVNDPETTITVFADVFNTPPLEGAAAAATLTLPPSLVRDLELVGSLQDLDVMIRYNFAAHLNDFFFQHRNNSRPFDEFDGLEIGGIFISAFLRDLEVEDLPENVTISFTKSEVRTLAMKSNVCCLKCIIHCVRIGPCLCCLKSVKYNANGNMYT